MKSTNLFSDFLIDSNADFYDMEIDENKNAFVQFFKKPVYLTVEDNQLQLLEVFTPLFIYEKGTLVNHPAGLVSGRRTIDPASTLTPGDLVEMDWYTDEFIYDYHPQTWCLTDTFRRITDLELQLIGQNITYSCKLFAFYNGFQKREYSWKTTSPINWFGKNGES